MIDTLPTGEVMGDMQAPLQWVLSHTAHFTGIVRVRHRTGEGFILIERQPVFWYFKSQKGTWTGPDAERHLKENGVLKFRLYRYSPGELTDALVFCRQSFGHGVVPGPAPDVPLQDDTDLPLREEKGEIPVFPSREAHDGEVLEEYEPHDAEEDPDFTAIQRFMQRSEILAAAIFKDGLSSGSVEGINIQRIVSRTRDALQLIHWFGSVIHMGAFVSLTIQTGRHYVIIRRHGSGHLLIVATSALPLGQVRTILRDIGDM